MSCPRVPGCACGPAGCPGGKPLSPGPPWEGPPKSRARCRSISAATSSSKERWVSGGGCACGSFCRPSAAHTHTRNQATRTHASTQHQPMSADVRALHAPTRCDAEYQTRGATHLLSICGRCWCIGRLATVTSSTAGQEPTAFLLPDFRAPGGAHTTNTTSGARSGRGGEQQWRPGSCGLRFTGVRAILDNSVGLLAWAYRPATSWRPGSIQ